MPLKILAGLGNVLKIACGPTPRTQITNGANNEDLPPFIFFPLTSLSVFLIFSSRSCLSFVFISRLLFLPPFQHRHLPDFLSSFFVLSFVICLPSVYSYSLHSSPYLRDHSQPDLMFALTSE